MTMFSHFVEWFRRSGFSVCAAVLLLAALAMGQVAARAQNAGPLYGAHGVSPQAVRQGILGSCYFHASIAALAKVAPETLRNAINRNPGDGYQVRFFDGPEELVFPEDVKYGRAHSFDRSDGDWVLVLMRGYAQREVRKSLAGAIQRSTLIPVYAKPVALSWLDQSGLLLVAYDRAIRSVVNQDGIMNKAALKQALATQLSALGLPAAEAQALGGFLEEKGFFDALELTVEQNGEVFGAYKSVGQGGIPDRVIGAFMGKGRSQLIADNRLLFDQLRRLHTGGVAMVAATWPTPRGAEYSRTDLLVPNHAYTLLDYDEATHIVSLRNPWGDHPDPDGVFTLPLAAFLRAYEFYSYSE